MSVNLLQKSEFFVTYLKNKIQLRTFVFYISAVFFKVYFYQVRHKYKFYFRKAFYKLDNYKKD